MEQRAKRDGNDRVLWESQEDAHQPADSSSKQICLLMCPRPVGVTKRSHIWENASVSQYYWQNETAS